MAAVTTSTAVALAMLSQPIKDIYSSGKERFGVALSKWGNSRSTASLIKKVACYEKVKTIWQRNKDVKLTSFYYPSKVTFTTGVTKKYRA